MIKPTFVPVRKVREGDGYWWLRCEDVANATHWVITRYPTCYDHFSIGREGYDSLEEVYAAVAAYRLGVGDIGP